MGTELATSQDYKGALQIRQNNTTGTVWHESGDAEPSGSATRFDITQESMAAQIDTKITEVVNGEPAAMLDQRRLGTQGCGGSFSFPMNGDVMQVVADFITGDATSKHSFVNATALPLYNIEVDKITEKHIYRNCRPNRVTIGSSGGNQDLMVTIDVLGSRVDVAESFTVAASPIVQAFQHYDSTLVVNIGGTTYFPESFEIVIDHGLDDGVFRNSTSRLAIPKGRRRVTGTIELDWSSATFALHSTNWLTDTPFSFDMTYAMTVGGTTYTWKMESGVLGCKFDGETPGLDANNSTMMLRLPFTSYEVTAGGGDDLNITQTTV